MVLYAQLPGTAPNELPMAFSEHFYLEMRRRPLFGLVEGSEKAPLLLPISNLWIPHGRLLPLLEQLDCYPNCGSLHDSISIGKPFGKGRLSCPTSNLLTQTHCNKWRWCVDIWETLTQSYWLSKCLSCPPKLIIHRTLGYPRNWGISNPSTKSSLFQNHLVAIPNVGGPPPPASIPSLHTEDMSLVNTLLSNS